MSHRNEGQLSIQAPFAFDFSRSMPRTQKKAGIVVSALRARTNFGNLLRQVEDERRSLVIEKRGTPRAVLLSIRDYVRLAAPEPEVLQVIGEQSRAKGTDSFSSQKIDSIIRATRAKKNEALMASGVVETRVSRPNCKRTEELVQSFLSGEALLLFVSPLISFARFSRASSVRGGSPAVSIDVKTA